MNKAEIVRRKNRAIHVRIDDGPIETGFWLNDCFHLYRDYKDVNYRDESKKMNEYQFLLQVLKERELLLGEKDKDFLNEIIRNGGFLKTIKGE